MVVSRKLSLGASSGSILQGSIASAVRQAYRCLLGSALCTVVAAAQLPATHDPVQYGPYNGVFLADGLGLAEPIANTHDSVLRSGSPWTIYCWVRSSEPVTQRELVAGLGETSSEYPRYLAIDKGRVVLWMGAGNEISAALPDIASWHLLSATFSEGRSTLYVDGKVASTGVLASGAADAILKLAPPVVVSSAGRHFGGQIAAFTLLRQALSQPEMQDLAKRRPDFDLLRFEQGSKPWPIQTRGQAGYNAPQMPSTMPVSRAPFSAPVAIKRAPEGASLSPVETGVWTFNDGWRLREAPKVSGDGAAISTVGYRSSDWMRATVPGTVLTTMVDDGIYPDPDYGLNNMAIPESLNRQDYWYRNEFVAPAVDVFGNGRHVELRFQGINYKADVWLNGKLLGSTKGAFLRASFDVTSLLKADAKNVLAVRISPPPHPGIPQEQSVLGGPGENGGAMELDGPTFLATEGWDWIPAIRDRNSGIWQPVVLQVTRGLRIGDAQVVTTFPNHDISHATVEIDVPVVNDSPQPIQATLKASMEQAELSKTLTLPQGESLIKLTPSEFAQLKLDHPRLWWPNGYGSPQLYHLKLTVAPLDTSVVSDSKEVRFGVREVSYELSLMDATGHLRRVEYFPSSVRGDAKPVVDVTHDGMIEIPSADAAALNVPESKRDRYPYQSHVASIAKGEESSAALLALTESGPAPYLVIKVNGVRIAVRGGNWGMDDSRKRVSRAHLEPFFRLDREAHLNMIRNWVGQNTEEVFYDLADEYGMLVWNDFWESTQNYNIEAEDPQLFLSNAADTIRHFRNHPSIVLWCGRNEGVPQPILNEGLDRLTRELDGTRYYSPSSNQVNLQDSGPYSYQAPALYFSQLNRGFSVETGTPSMSTLESFQSTVPKADQWPIDDVWAYHDWHQSGNGDVGTFMGEIESEFGAANSLEDFERKAQMLNYVDHRAIFEGMNANLWTPNSGRMLWMTQPAWPSTHWQILSSDYDTQASFYGVKKACEPVHIQMNLATYGVDIVNLTRDDLRSVTATEKIYSLDNRLLSSATETKDVTANSKLAALQLPLAGLLAKGMVIVQLKLRDAAGKVLSENVYWLGEKPSSYRELNQLAAAAVTMHASSRVDMGVMKVRVELTNNGKSVSLANKLTLLAAKTEARILPAYYSDNYISLLPGETRVIEIEAPTDGSNAIPEIALRGWNTIPQTAVPR
jgi:hypothetical protein